jgi:hypothetical protein
MVPPPPPAASRAVSHRPAASKASALGPLLPSRPRPPPQGRAPMALAPQSRAGDGASRGGRLGAPSPRSSGRPSASCLPPAALPSPPLALSAPAPTEPPSPAPPLGVAAAAAASPAAENEAASRSSGRALGHLIGRAGAPARPDAELRPAALVSPRGLTTAQTCRDPAPGLGPGREWGRVLCSSHTSPTSRKFPSHTALKTPRGGAPDSGLGAPSEFPSHCSTGRQTNGRSPQSTADVASLPGLTPTPSRCEERGGRKRRQLEFLR